MSLRLLFALFTNLGAFSRRGRQCFATMLILMFFSQIIDQEYILDDAADMLGTVGAVNMLPMLLATHRCGIYKLGWDSDFNAAVKFCRSRRKCEHRHHHFTLLA